MCLACGKRQRVRALGEFVCHDLVPVFTLEEINSVLCVPTRSYVKLIARECLTNGLSFSKISLAAHRGNLRGVAQPGSARALGAWGRGFKSLHPDHFRVEDMGPRGQAVKTPPFHGGNRGSSPLGVTTF